jgi:L-iditol 2-dehydrogenase
MRALVIEAPHRLDLRELPKPEVASQDILIRVKFGGICGSDLHAQEGLRIAPWIKYPVVLGHEFSGVIADRGDDVDADFREGDPVVTETVVKCGLCDNCNRGRTNLCLNYSEIGFLRDGGFADYVLTPARLVHKLPKQVSLEHAAMLEPLSCVCQAVGRAAIEAGEIVMITGDGPIGLLSLLVARLSSPKCVVMTGVIPERLQVAEKLGAVGLNVKRDNVPNRLRELTNGLGPDVIIECSGSPDSIADALGWVRSTGRIVLIGVTGGGKRVPISTDDFVVKDLAVRGSAGNTQASWHHAIALLATGLVDVSPLITHRFELSQWQQAFDLVRSKDSGVLKALLSPT